MKSLIRDFAGKYGVSVSRYSSDNKIRALVRSLRPVTTERPLIRVGGEGDGGYLVPDDLQGVSACFSPGVDVVASFEKDLIDRGIPCFLTDASVENAPIEGPLLDFQKKFLGLANVADHITLDAWVAQKWPTNGDLILQMDIEGAEWPIILNVSDETLSRFRIIVIELHQMNHLVERVAFPMLEAAINRLTEKFYVVHVHPNNYAKPLTVAGTEIPPFLEVTFYRADRANVTGFASTFPHSLDRRNVENRRDLPLHRSWYLD